MNAPRAISPFVGLDRLPDFLEYVSEDIRIAGHRISLLLIVDDFIDGVPFSDTRNKYNSIPDVLLRAALSFCERHEDAVRAYGAERMERIEAAMRHVGDAPSFEELRRRKAGKARTG